MNRHNIPLGIDFGFLCLLGVVFFIVFYYLGKDYFGDNNLFRKGKIAESLEGFFSNLKESIGIPKKRIK